MITESFEDFKDRLHLIARKAKRTGEKKETEPTQGNNSLHLAGSLGDDMRHGRIHDARLGSLLRNFLLRLFDFAFS